MPVMAQHEKLVQGVSYFSTDGGKRKPRAACDGLAPVVRSNREADKAKMIADLRAKYPAICNSIWAPWDLRWFYDEYDFITLGPAFLFDMIGTMQHENENSMFAFCNEWVKVNPTARDQVMQLEPHRLFANSEFERYGSPFMMIAALELRREIYWISPETQAKFNLRDGMTQNPAHPAVNGGIFLNRSWDGSPTTQHPEPNACDALPDARFMHNGNMPHYPIQGPSGPTGNYIVHGGPHWGNPRGHGPAPMPHNNGYQPLPVGGPDGTPRGPFPYPYAPTYVPSAQGDVDMHGPSMLMPNGAYLGPQGLPVFPLEDVHNSAHANQVPNQMPTLNVNNTHGRGTSGFPGGKRGKAKHGQRQGSMSFSDSSDRSRDEFPAQSTRFLKSRRLTNESARLPAHEEHPDEDLVIPTAPMADMVPAEMRVSRTFIGAQANHVNELWITHIEKYSDNDILRIFNQIAPVRSVDILKAMTRGGPFGFLHVENADIARKILTEAPKCTDILVFVSRRFWTEMQGHEKPHYHRNSYPFAGIRSGTGFQHNVHGRVLSLGAAPPVAPMENLYAPRSIQDCAESVSDAAATAASASQPGPGTNASNVHAPVQANDARAKDPAIHDSAQKIVEKADSKGKDASKELPSSDLKQSDSKPSDVGAKTATDPKPVEETVTTPAKHVAPSKDIAAKDVAMETRDVQGPGQKVDHKTKNGDEVAEVKSTVVKPATEVSSAQIPQVVVTQPTQTTDTLNGIEVKPKSDKKPAIKTEVAHQQSVQESKPTEAASTASSAKGARKGPKKGPKTTNVADKVSEIKSAQEPAKDAKAATLQSEKSTAKDAKSTTSQPEKSETALADAQKATTIQVKSTSSNLNEHAKGAASKPDQAKVDMRTEKQQLADPKVSTTTSDTQSAPKDIGKPTDRPQAKKAARSVIVPAVPDIRKVMRAVSAPKPATKPDGNDKTPAAQSISTKVSPHTQTTDQAIKTVAAEAPVISKETVKQESSGKAEPQESTSAPMSSDGNKESGSDAAHGRKKSKKGKKYRKPKTSKDTTRSPSPNNDDQSSKSRRSSGGHSTPEVDRERLKFLSTHGLDEWHPQFAKLSNLIDTLDAGTQVEWATKAKNLEQRLNAAEDQARTDLPKLGDTSNTASVKKRLKKRRADRVKSHAQLVEDIVLLTGTVRSEHERARIEKDRVSSGGSTSNATTSKAITDGPARHASTQPTEPVDAHVYHHKRLFSHAIEERNLTEPNKLTNSTGSSSGSTDSTISCGRAHLHGDPGTDNAALNAKQVEARLSIRLMDLFGPQTSNGNSEVQSTGGPHTRKRVVFHEQEAGDTLDFTVVHEPASHSKESSGETQVADVSDETHHIEFPSIHETPVTATATEEALQVAATDPAATEATEQTLPEVDETTPDVKNADAQPEECVVKATADTHLDLPTANDQPKVSTSDDQPEAPSPKPDTSAAEDHKESASTADLPEVSEPNVKPELSAPKPQQHDKVVEAAQDVTQAVPESQEDESKEQIAPETSFADVPQTTETPLEDAKVKTGDSGPETVSVDSPAPTTKDEETSPAATIKQEQASPAPAVKHEEASSAPSVKHEDASPAKPEPTQGQPTRTVTPDNQGTGSQQSSKKSSPQRSYATVVKSPSEKSTANKEDVKPAPKTKSPTIKKETKSKRASKTPSPKLGVTSKGPSPEPLAASKSKSPDSHDAPKDQSTDSRATTKAPSPDSHPAAKAASPKKPSSTPPTAPAKVPTPEQKKVESGKSSEANSPKDASAKESTPPHDAPVAVTGQQNGKSPPSSGSSKRSYANVAKSPVEMSTGSPKMPTGKRATSPKVLDLGPAAFAKVIPTGPKAQNMPTGPKAQNTGNVRKYTPPQARLANASAAKTQSKAPPKADAFPALGAPPSKPAVAPPTMSWAKVLRAKNSEPASTGAPTEAQKVSPPPAPTPDTTQPQRPSTKLRLSTNKENAGRDFAVGPEGNWAEVTGRGRGRGKTAAKPKNSQTRLAS